MKIKDVISDPVLFCSRLKIIDKSGKMITLRPNSEQIQIIKSLSSGDDTLVLKARQIGSTKAPKMEPRLARASH